MRCYFTALTRRNGRTIVFDIDKRRLAINDRDCSVRGRNVAIPVRDGGCQCDAERAAAGKRQRQRRVKIVVIRAMVNRQILIDNEMRRDRIAWMLDRYPKRDIALRSANAANNLGAFTEKINLGVGVVSRWICNRKRGRNAAILTLATKRQGEGIICSAAVFASGAIDREKVCERKVAGLLLPEGLRRSLISVVSRRIAVVKVQADGFIQSRKFQRALFSRRNMNLRRIVDDADRKRTCFAEGKVIAIDVRDMHQRGEIKEQRFFQVAVRRRAGIGRVNRMIDLVEQLEVIGAVRMDGQPEDFVESILTIGVPADNGIVAGDRGVDGAIVQFMIGGLHNSAGAVDNR